MGGSKSPQVPLKTVTINDESEESDFGGEIVEYIFEPKEQANTFSNKWSKVFMTNNKPNFNRANKRFTDNWYNVIKDELKEDSIIQGWANFSVQGPHSKFHNFIGLHSILIKITDI